MIPAIILVNNKKKEKSRGMIKRLMSLSRPLTAHTDGMLPTPRRDGRSLGAQLLRPKPTTGIRRPQPPSGLRGDLLDIAHHGARRPAARAALDPAVLSVERRRVRARETNRWRTTGTHGTSVPDGSDARVPLDATTAIIVHFAGAGIVKIARHLNGVVGDIRRMGELLLLPVLLLGKHGTARRAVRRMLVAGHGTPDAAVARGGVRVAVVVLVVQGGHGTHAARGLAVAHRVAAPAAAAEPDAREDGEGAHGRAHGNSGNGALGKGRRAGARGRRDRCRGR